MATPEKQLASQKWEGHLALSNLAVTLSELGSNFYDRGWILGTSGNFSVLINRNPLKLAITASGADKGTLTPDRIVQIDDAGKPIAGTAAPSEEALLHIAVMRASGASAVLHTHSVWSTLLSEVYAEKRGLEISGYEMLKGLSGVRTHEHTEWMPILENSQDLKALAGMVEETLRRLPQTHAFLLRRHGLYTWGDSLLAAKRHIEILEFLMEVVGRLHCSATGDGSRREAPHSPP